MVSHKAAILVVLCFSIIIGGSLFGSPYFLKVMNYLNILKGTCGILAMQVLSDASFDDVDNIIKLAGQVVILLLTLWGLLQKAKKSN